MLRRLRLVYKLGKGTDIPATINEISEGVKLQGYNVWILVCSALLASIGLDTNSVAVIIGAMLISPLMSPILGIGLSVGIHDKDLFLQSLRNFVVAFMLSLVASVCFFLVTPLKAATSELLSRTYPTLLDVMIAFFGGVAGIVAISRKDKTNAIPGVAIATALMPPICTSGYGLATLQFDIFLGAFYLFFINAVFISLATYFMVKYLKFPVKKYDNRPREKLYSRWATVLLIIVIIPSGYFLYNVYKKQMIHASIESNIIARLEKSGREVLKWNLLPKNNDYDLKIYYSGKVLRESEIDSLQQYMLEHRMRRYILKPYRMNITKDEVNALSAEVANNIFAQMVELKSQNTHEVDTISVLREIQLIIPSVDSPQIINTIMVDSVARFSYTPIGYISPKEDTLLYRYLVQRLYLDTIIIIPRMPKKP